MRLSVISLNDKIEARNLVALQGWFLKEGLLLSLLLSLLLLQLLLQLLLLLLLLLLLMSWYRWLLFHGPTSQHQCLC